MRAPVIGLEIHLAVATRSKMFCGCDAGGFGAPPNTHVCPVCLGLPGALPVANAQAIELGLRFVLALGCTVPDRTQFHRKHYVYPDAPKNYQISQYDRPLGEHGRLMVPGGRTIRVERCHLEEDAGRLVHPAYADHSLVDLNRAGAPLLEMVTAPEIERPEEARAFLTEVRALARALGVSDASPEAGKMRADVNVSLRNPDGSFGTKVEVKNLNSFRSVEAALHFEIRRQERLLDEGYEVAQETRGWNEGGQKTVAQRGKEGAADYRYLPDPDLPEIDLPRERRERIVAAMPETPAAKRARYREIGVRAAEADLIALDPDASALFDAVRDRFDGPAQTVATWLTVELAGLAGREAPAAHRPDTPDRPEVDPARLAALLSLVHDRTISHAAAKELLPEVVAGADPARLVEDRGLARVSDEDALLDLIRTVMDENPAIVASAREEPKAINALLGRVMKASGGAADPQAVRRLLTERIQDA